MDREKSATARTDPVSHRHLFHFQFAEFSSRADVSSISFAPVVFVRLFYSDGLDDASNSTTEFQMVHGAVQDQTVG
jgi:hypothetical protein